MLCSFNHAIEERFFTDYGLRARCCFGHLHRVIVDIMRGQDFQSMAKRELKGPAPRRLPSLRRNEALREPTPSLLEDVLNDDELLQLQRDKKKELRKHSFLQQIDGFLGSLDDCLSHKMGALYFKKYLQEQFCVENFLFHEAVLAYKGTKSTQRIKMGEEMMSKFIESGSPMEVNLSYSTRFQCLQIVDLVKRMNDNKEKYEQLLTMNKSQSIMNEEDLQSLAVNGGHHRMETTKKLPLELAEVTNDANENIQDVIYSMGFTESLFDKAYGEILDLMRTNSWSTFRRKILDICGDDDFARMQSEKLQKKKEEQRSHLGMIQVVHSIANSHRKHQHHIQQMQRLQIQQIQCALTMIGSNKNHRI